VDQAILSLRALIQSKRFDEAWYLLAEGYKGLVALFDNLISLRPRQS